MRAARSPALAVAGLAAALWSGVVLGLGGPREENDSKGYYQVANALAEGRVLTEIDPLATQRGTGTFRTPGYPLFILATRGLASVLGTDRRGTIGVVQALLCAGLGTLLIADIVVRLTRSPAAGTLAALLYALDVDVQHLSATVLSESLAVTLAILAVWLRLRDRGWRRAGWAAAGLVLTRPDALAVVLGFAALELARRRVRAAAQAATPALALLVAWFVLSAALGGHPMVAQRDRGTLVAFGRILQFRVWLALPPGPERTLLESVVSPQRDAYTTTAVLHQAGDPDAPARIVRATIRAAPGRYFWSCLAAIPSTITANAYYLSPPQSAPRHAHILRPLWLWRQAYRVPFYSSFALFAAILAAAAATGFGRRRALPACRRVLVPYAALVVTSLGFLAMGTYEIGRLAVSVHPFFAVLLALAFAQLGRLARRRRPATAR
jgi:hypothetical protein